MFVHHPSMTKLITGPPTQASHSACEDIVTISDRACRVANGRARQGCSPTRARLLLGTVAAENACRAHNEARHDGEKSSRKGTKQARQAIGLWRGATRGQPKRQSAACSESVTAFGTHETRMRALYKTAGVPCTPCHIHISERCTTGRQPGTAEAR
jgi:hypothetical protein